ncbi:MAG: sulfite exporter TauE/SafE family protein [Pelagibacteraceae bacterium]
MSFLIILFFITAAIYSSVGFGGGSTYLALLLLWGVPFTIFPVIALCCNIIVVSGNCINYTRAGHLNFKLLIPFLIGSIPLAYIGGALPIEKEIFEILLFLILSIAGILLLINFKTYDDKQENYRKIPFLFSVLIGGVLGFLSGIVGIGGGIFLSPILFLIRAAKPKHIVTAASIFILINSLSGILGQITKNEVLNEILNYWPLLLAVFIGGQIGNFINIKILPTRILALITSGLVLFVAARMFYKIFIN